MTTASMPLFYNSIAALDRNTHARLRISPPDNFSFTADAALVPVLAAEFGPIAREYAIVFVGDEGKEFIPVSLTGMPQGKNLFLEGNGQWAARYVPAYVRRYPFAFFETTPEQFTVCVDPSSKFLDESVGTPLFENGEPSALLQDTIKRLADYHRMTSQTKVFMQKLIAANLLMEANAKADLPDGRSFAWRGFWVVDETRFRELPETTMKEWFATGELGLVYAHLLSLGNLGDLLRRHHAAGSAA
jgi:SapC